MAVLSYGPIGNDVEKAINELAAEGSTLSVAHYDMRFCKPLDETLRKHLISKFWGDDPTHYDFDNYLHI